MGSVCFEIAAQAPDRDTDTDTDIVAIYSCSTYADIHMLYLYICLKYLYVSSNYNLKINGTFTDIVPKHTYK